MNIVWYLSGFFGASVDAFERPGLSEKLLPLWYQSRSMVRTHLVIRRCVWLATVVMVLGTLALIGTFHQDIRQAVGPKHGLKKSDSTGEFEKPVNLTIIGMVFYGRRARVEMLDCYLKKELVENGGMLDSIEWVANTVDADDLRWLDEVLIPSCPSYKRIDVPETRAAGDYGSLWDSAKRGNLYIKIDDDVSFIDSNAIRELIRVRVLNPNAFLVSANVVNSPLMSWVHYRTGAVHPYMPELHPPPAPSSPSLPENATGQAKVSDWRASTQPTWSGPTGTRMELDADPPFSGHRWLPTRGNPEYPLRNTPIAQSEYAPWGKSYKWPVVAQEHASLLENIEDGRLDLYGTRSGVWDVTGERLTINLIALWGDDLVREGPLHDDELELSKSIPDTTQRPIIVATNAIASHYSFQNQESLKESNLLDRYEAYTREMSPSTLHQH